MAAAVRRGKGRMVGFPCLDLAPHLVTDPSYRLLWPCALFLGQTCSLGGGGGERRAQLDAGVLMELLLRSHTSSSSFPARGVIMVPSQCHQTLLCTANGMGKASSKALGSPLLPATSCD